MYKWAYSGRGCAIQYITPSDQPSAFPSRVSIFYKTPYPMDFIVQGARDDSAYHSADYAVEFINWIGGNVSWSLLKLHIITGVLVTYNGIALFL